MKLKDLNTGKLFTLEPNIAPKDSEVYVKHFYAPEYGGYSCTLYSDFDNEIFLSPYTEVFTEFIF